jgi:hypothetical protein
MAKFKVGDKVRILDGSNIKNYTGSWCAESMKKFVGEVDVIEKVIVRDDGNVVGYYMEHNSFIWDERGLELAENKRKFKVGGKVKETLPQKIVITTDGKRTTAVLYDGKKHIKESSAVCSDDDEFNFMTGAKIAFERLTEEKEPERDLRELLKDGVFGKERESGNFVIVNGFLVYENGGYDCVSILDRNLESDSGFTHIDELYSGVKSFDRIGRSTTSLLWKRKEIK